jgi:GPH family glycoside/pentoside/hexuronide:cation symporter
MGWINDHTNSRWGKRRPYLLFGAISYALAYLALWTVPELATETQTFLYVTVAAIIFNTCFTVVFVPYTALTAVMTTDYNERSSLTGYRITASQVGFLIGASLPIIIVQWVQKEENAETLQEMYNSLALLSPYVADILFGSWTGTARQGYFFSAIIISLAIIITVWIAFFGTRERNISESPESSNPFEYITGAARALYSQQSFRLAVGIMLLTNCAATLIGVNLAFFLENGVGLAELQDVIIPLIFVTAVLAVPFWTILARKIGKAETYRIAMSLYCIVLIFLYLTPEGGSTYILCVAIPAGFFHAAALMLPWAIIPDIVEEDQLISGTRREGLFYGGTTFSYKFATALAIFISGQFLSFIGYTPGVEQTEVVKTGLRSIVSLAPIVFILMAMVLAFRYPLTAERHREILLELERMK